MPSFKNAQQDILYYHCRDHAYFIFLKQEDSMSGYFYIHASDCETHVKALLDKNYQKLEEKTYQNLPRNQELEQNLFKNSEDREAWLVYADWLQSQGDFRGEIITLAQLPKTAAIENHLNTLINQQFIAIAQILSNSLSDYIDTTSHLAKNAFLTIIFKQEYQFLSEIKLLFQNSKTNPQWIIQILQDIVSSIPICKLFLNQISKKILEIILEKNITIPLLALQVGAFPGQKLDLGKLLQAFPHLQSLTLNTNHIYTSALLSHNTLKELIIEMSAFSYSEVFQVIDDKHKLFSVNTLYFAWQQRGDQKSNSRILDNLKNILKACPNIQYLTLAETNRRKFYKTNDCWEIFLALLKNNIINHLKNIKFVQHGLTEIQKKEIKNKLGDKILLQFW